MKIPALLLCLIAFQLQAQDIASTANAFLSSLDKDQKSKALYTLDDAERFNWHFVPRDRNGVCFKTFTAGQRAAALAFFKASFGESGYTKAIAIMANEEVLRQLENLPVGNLRRDPLNYYITFFGNPSATAAWAWRFEGHHIAFNFSSVNNEMVSSTPSFFGSNPAIVPSGPEKGREILKLETDLGLQLVNSLSPDQKNKAIISEKALPEIISFNNRKALPLTPTGLGYSELSKDQQKVFMTLLNVYVKNYQFGFSKKLMEKIEKAGINNLTFAWAGGMSTKPGGTYYRIQGPMLLIEFDNTQTDANHVHAALRDLTNDFAEDILREHYQKEHP